MICGFCGHVFSEEYGKQGCGGCYGGCHSIHCPECNYKNPIVPEIIQKFKRMFVKGVDK